MRGIVVCVVLAASGCSGPWGRLEPGSVGAIAQPKDSRLGTVLKTGQVVAAPMLPIPAGPTYEPSPQVGPWFLNPGQSVRVVAENEYAAPDDRGRHIEVLILEGPHNGLHAMIRRDQFTPRSTP